MALVMAAMGILQNQRSARQDRERGRLQQELAAAAEVQALLVPSQSTPGVETVYLPAAEVGGDFYQILDRPDGSWILVIGDVSGKGLKAAMLVSVVIGALRQSEESAPGAILAGLNRVLHGQTGGGFVTALWARFSANGSVTVANAGHLAPYADGQEAAVDSGLPLGLVPEANYAETALNGCAFTFVTDGVVEAGEKELFGFDRTREISTRPAAEIAEAARAWGQNDDITVVTVRRSP
jgi:serine phosphatase RsbU (regulator of sigma subunit)